MSYQIGTAIIALTMLVWSGAFVRADEEAPRAATPEELFDRFADTTQILKDGVAYYSATGVLLLVQGDEKRAGRWSTTDTGAVCWELKGADTPDCIQYVLFQGLFYSSVDGHIRGRPDLQAGNLLAEAANAKAFAESVQLFTLEQTRELIMGKTAIRSSNGRMYYGADQTLKTNWNGVAKTGTWSIDDQGGVCWHVVGWGEQPCEYYFHGRDGTIWSRFRGLDRVAAEHVAGDQTE